MSQKSLVILSIGSARPVASKILTESLQVSEEIILSAIYKAPAILFHDLEEGLLQKAAELLNQMGLETLIIDSADAVQYIQPKAVYDVCIYLDDPMHIATVNDQLCDFLGCTVQEGLHLLLQHPPVVIGGVSLATVQAMQKRIDAKIIAADAQLSTFTIVVETEDDLTLRQVQELLGSHARVVDGFSYERAQEIWRRFSAPGVLKLVNETFNQYNVVLEACPNNTASAALLENLAGIPQAEFELVLENLPLELFEALSTQELKQIQPQLEAAGIQCSYTRIPQEAAYLQLHQLSDNAQAAKILAEVLPAAEVQGVFEGWVSPQAQPLLLARYLKVRLDSIDCESEIIFQSQLSSIQA